MSARSRRYIRQELFVGLGASGQERLGRGTAVIVGLGALGSVSASYLARAGVGRLRLVDRDLVDVSNLHRQLLYDEEDARQGLPKAIAAVQHLQRANSEIEISGHVDDLTAGSVDALLHGADVVLDGTDNFEARFLINEWCVREDVPWVYAAAVSAYGLTFPILPGETACLTCVFEAAPPPELSPTCDTAGVIGPITGVVASLQAGEALKLLAGCREAVTRALTVVELWAGRIQQVELGRAAADRCPVCRLRRFPHLEAEDGSGTARLCGRNAMQVSPRRRRAIDLEALARRLEGSGPVSRNPYLLRIHVEGHDLTVFADGRVLVSGTEDPAAARSLVARYVGA